MKRGLLLFVIGFLVGSVFDSFHTISGTTVYTNPSIFKMAWWSPFIFGLATLLIGLLLPVIDGLLKSKERQLTPLVVVYGLIAFGVVYFLSGFALRFKLSPNLVVPLGAIVIWFIFDKSWQSIIEGFLVAFFGIFGEVLLIKTSLFYYTNSSILGVPFWLPALYFTASVAIGNLGRYLKQNRS